METDIINLSLVFLIVAIIVLSYIVGVTYDYFWGKDKIPIRYCQTHGCKLEVKTNAESIYYDRHTGKPKQKINTYLRCSVVDDGYTLLLDGVKSPKKTPCKTSEFLFWRIIDVPDQKGEC